LSSARIDSQNNRNENKAKQAENTAILAMTNNTDMTDTAIAKALNISLERVRKVRNQTL